MDKQFIEIKLNCCYEEMIMITEVETREDVELVEPEVDLTLSSPHCPLLPALL
jgi:hypothetical protein